jgi:hypothetical protein
MSNLPVAVAVAVAVSDPVIAVTDAVAIAEGCCNECGNEIESMFCHSENGIICPCCECERVFAQRPRTQRVASMNLMIIQLQDLTIAKLKNLVTFLNAYDESTLVIPSNVKKGKRCELIVRWIYTNKTGDELFSIEDAIANQDEEFLEL